MSNQAGKPCHCDELPPLDEGAESVPVGSIRAALAALGGLEMPAAAGAEMTIGDPAAVAPVSEAGLAALVALARANPGLKITLSF